MAYTMDFFLNSGFGGTVHAASNSETGETFAIKTVRKTQKNINAIQREITCIRNLVHPCIITTIEVVENENEVQFVQEYARGGDLFDHIQRFGCMTDETSLKSLFGQITSALAFMHSHGFCHRDIKPENIVLTRETDFLSAKLIDFGLSENEKYVHGRVGTDAYAAPEVAGNLPGQYVDGFAADIWSLGIVLVALLCGRIPWAVATCEDADYTAFLTRQSSNCPAAVFNTCVDTLGLAPTLTTLLDSILSADPSARPSAVHVLAMLDSPWFRLVHDVHEDGCVHHLAGQDSGCSWGDFGPEDEVDFSVLPLPCFEPLVSKTDSGFSLS